ncbi:DNA-directed RNA polymerase, subunit E'' [Candidatus Micrarchaeota archaeon]|nr:DNA-directed RNA polymerase, subunit E'' [Candidatus Micrarchaeota archaeon]
MKACRECKRLIEDSNTCPACNSEELSERFSGLLIVLDAEKSEIAKIAEVKAPGRYAVNVK